MKINRDRIKAKLIKILPLYLKAVIRILLRRAAVSESEIIYKLFKSSKKSKTLIDVGAHYGGALAPFLYDGWQVYAFEPDINNRCKLTETFGQYSNIVIDPRAVSNTIKKDLPFYNSDVSTGISTLCPFHPSHKELDVKVDTITLQSYIESQKIPAVDFLKIDVEGFDLFVLKGFPWSKMKPQVILAEFENRKTIPLGYTFHDIAKYLMNKGYKLLVSEWYPLIEYGLVHNWRRFETYPCELLDNEAAGNIIAVSDSKVFDNLLDISNKYSTLVHRLGQIYRNIKSKNR